MAPSSANITTCQPVSSARAASGGIFLDGLGEMKMSEIPKDQEQIDQINEQIEALQAQCARLKKLPGAQLPGPTPAVWLTSSET